MATMHPTCPSTGIFTDTLMTSAYSSNLQSIGFRCGSSASAYNLAVKAIVPVTGVSDQWGDIYVSNLDCIPQDATVTLHYDKHYNVNRGGWLDVNPTPVSYSDSTITWNVRKLASSDAKPVDLYYAIWSSYPTGPAVGYRAHSYCTVYPKVGDDDSSNNIQIRNDTVRGGCDPNEMEVNPSGIIKAGTVLQYTINFTNVGNDTTYNVYVMDTLSDNVDVNSFRLIMTSANMNVAKLKNNGHNILKFDFPAINLLDSARHPQNCSRAFIFSVATKSGLPFGTKIDNHAGVFFDYNPVVMTNVVENIIGIPTSVATAAISTGYTLYPNPATNDLNIGEINEPTIYVISNVLGENMKSGQLRIGSNVIDVSAFPKGVYFIEMNGIGTKKFVKL
ncbi:MAG: T9SS type A sorting domain-containing protein [Taibaiella sp.]|nr:T9SS type A sorting domain-containing protein [Taibaiella sp.]